MISLMHVVSIGHVLAALAASMHAVLVHPQARGAALWLGIIWLVPWVGPLLYVAVGVNRMPRRARGRIHIGTATTSEWRPGSCLLPLVGGDSAYREMLAAIEEAERSIHLATYIFDNDRAGALFRDALHRAVARGVIARVLIDALGARYSRPSVVRSLRRGGVQVARFLPTAMPWRWQYANLRNHRKLMVVDGVRGFMGGMNIREACMASFLPAEPTLDVHFRVDGPVVGDLAALFAADWEFATGQTLATSSTDAATEQATSAARLIFGGPDRIDEPIRWLKLAAVVRAKHRVRIMTPYFVPDEDVLTALCAAVSAGVKIQVILPAVNNLRLIAWASRACWERLLERGIEVALSPPPFDHSKLMIVDDDLAIVGSANWDERSFRLNFEADLECRDLNFVAQLDALVDRRLVNASFVTLEQLANCSVWSRLRDRLARLGLPYL